jgi:hypothetical protein
MAKKSKKKKNIRSGNCRPTYRVSRAGHLLRMEADSEAGFLLATEGKKQKQRRRAKGCLNGLSGAAVPKRQFRLTERQKRKLPVALQRAIINYHRSKAK